jgi:hypothetical protein
MTALYTDLSTHNMKMLNYALAALGQKKVQEQHRNIPETRNRISLCAVNPYSSRVCGFGRNKPMLTPCAVNTG